MSKHRYIPGQMKIDFGEDFYGDFADDPQSTASLSEIERTDGDVASHLIHYVSLGSGSSGNCCYLGTHRGGVLIDAGVRAENVEIELKRAGIEMSDVRAILLTHDHSDHVRYAYNILRKYKHLHLYCTNKVMNGILRKHSVSRRIRDFHIPIFKEIPFKVMDFEVTAFEVPHDGTDNMGFSLEFDGRRFVIATDMGAVWPRARHYIGQADYLVIEANYDEQMLRDGSYPEYLKARIRTEHGHMRNEDTGAFVAEIFNPRLKYVFLCHLSADNNTPDKALSAVKGALEQAGVSVGGTDDTLSDAESDVRLAVLPRFEATRRFVFRP